MTSAPHMERKLYDRAIRYFRKKVRREIAEDLAHDALLRWHSCNKGHENPEALFLHAAYCVLIDHVRQRTNRADADLSYPARLNNARDIAEVIEAEDFAVHVLAKLPPRNREIIFHLKFLGCSSCEVQRKFGITENTVENHWRDAKLYLDGVLV